MAAANPTAQQRAALAVQKVKVAKQHIRDIWTTRSSIQYTDAWKVTWGEVDAVLETAKWEKEYEAPGRNTHVNII